MPIVTIQITREGTTREQKATIGKVSGAGGAAQLLGLKSTTLASRINALGIIKFRGAKPRTASPGPARMIDVVGQSAAQRLEAG